MSLYVYTSVFIHAYIHICIGAYTYVHRYIYIYIFIHIHTYIYIYRNKYYIFIHIMNKSVYINTYISIHDDYVLRNPIKPHHLFISKKSSNISLVYINIIQYTYKYIHNFIYEVICICKIYIYTYV
jgi:hypothetical protein